MDYKKAGVDIEAGYKSVELMKEHKDLLEFIANRLLEIETMDGKEFYEIVKGEVHCRELAEQAKLNEENTTSTDEEK